VRVHAELRKYINELHIFDLTLRTQKCDNLIHFEKSICKGRARRRIRQGARQTERLPAILQ